MRALPGRRCSPMAPRQPRASPSMSERQRERAFGRAPRHVSGMIVVPQRDVGASRRRCGGSDAHRIYCNRTQRPFSQYSAARGRICFGSCGPGAATLGLESQMPREDGAGRARRPCSRWRRCSWVVTAATAETPCEVAGYQLAVVGAAGKYVAQGGLIGGRVIASCEGIARGPSYRARRAEVCSFSGRLDVRRDRSRCRGHAHRFPVYGRGLLRRTDASGIGRQARGESVR